MGPMWARSVVLLLALAGCDLVFSLERPKPPRGEWTQVAAGERHTCAIKADGTLWCWGDNRYGAVAAPEETTFAGSPRQVGTATWRQVSTRYHTTCGIQTAGSLWCWGLNSAGEAADTGISFLYEPFAVGGGPWTRVDVGVDHSCAIDDADRLWCWGYGGQGRLGDGLSTSSRRPVMVAGGPWTDVSVGFDHTCAVSGTTVWCWGVNLYGQLADPTVGDRTSPNQVDGAWVEVAAGDSFTCLRDSEGSVTCAGQNDNGELGNGSTRNSRIGSLLGGEGVWSTIVAGRSHACGLRDGSLWCWGASEHGEIPGTQPGQVASSPQLVADPQDLTWTQISLGLHHTCAVDDGGRLYCAGANGSDELGQNTSTTVRGAPAQVEGEWSAVALGKSFTCALARDGKVACWGQNDRFQLGDGSQQPQQEPQVVKRIDVPVTEVVAGNEIACARGTARDVRYCWGWNSSSELGDPATQPSYLPAEVPREIRDTWFPSAISSRACGFDGNGTAGCWGENYYGGVGAGTYNPTYPDPTPLATGNSYTKLFVGGLHSCGIHGTTLGCWGYNASGQLGNGDMTMQDVPIDVGGATTMVDAALGNSHSCALDEGGVISCWGAGGFGQLGHGGASDRTSPTAIPGQWRQLTAGDRFTCAIAIDSTLWCWGENVSGQLGDGTYRRQLSPVKIGTRSDWTRVAAGRDHACALAGTSLWCWGENNEGELGTNTAWRAELVRVPD